MLPLLMLSEGFSRLRLVDMIGTDAAIADVFGKILLSEVCFVF